MVKPKKKPSSLKSLAGIIFKDSMIATASFIIGFIIGTLVDTGFFSLYVKWDPEEKSIWKLSAIVLAQIYVLMLVYVAIEKFKEYENLHGVITRLGFIISQIFMFEYAVARYGQLIYRGEGAKVRKRVLDSAIGTQSGSTQ